MQWGLETASGPIIHDLNHSGHKMIQLAVIPNFSRLRSSPLYLRDSQDVSLRHICKPGRAEWGVSLEFGDAQTRTLQQIVTVLTLTGRLILFQGLLRSR
jgi:hypothetical protein